MLKIQLLMEGNFKMLWFRTVFDTPQRIKNTKFKIPDEDCECIVILKGQNIQRKASFCSEKNCFDVEVH